MATSAYYAWDRAGRPWKVAAPVKALGDRLRGYGYTVYYLGSDDASHLQANTPEDHCPFSVTGWPGAHPYPYVTAMDVMPPPAGSGLPTLQQLGARLVADRNAGHPGLGWLKYMNWEPDRDWGGSCWHDSWQPNFARRSSSDRGHIHASGRSDMVADAGAAATYDPVARIRGTAEEGDDDVLTLKQEGWVNNGDKYGWALTALRPTARVRDESGKELDIPNELAATLRRLEAAAAADERRDLAMKAVLDAIAAGGASVDTGVILARMNELAVAESATVADLRARIDDLQDRLAAAQRAAAEVLDPGGS